MQEQILRGDFTKGEVRSERNLAMFEFVLDHGDFPISSDRWDELFEHWNEIQTDARMQFPISKFPKRRSARFKEVFQEVKKKYLLPDYKLPVRETRTDAEHWEEEKLVHGRAVAEAEIRRNTFLLGGNDPEDFEYPEK